MFRFTIKDVLFNTLGGTFKRINTSIVQEVSAYF